ncbi:MAG: hypothetical protein M1827_006703 [Pycnora praestabilis]|nr:MAG: hypothetical protein M1827_006703 [Pycnora praestabilis]
MSLQTHSSSSAPTPIPTSGCFDPLDIDSFINYDQVVYQSPSDSSSLSRSQNASHSSSSTGHQATALLISSQSNSQQNLPPPSHQYDSYQQQTGLPVDGLALAYKQASNLPLIRNQTSFDTSNDSFFGVSPNNEFIDFSVGSGSNPSFDGPSDMDIEYDSPSRDGFPPFFYPTERSLSSNAEYIDPSAISGQDELATPSDLADVSPAQSNVGRLWPGMHQQQAAQAALAKAQVQAQGQTQAEAHNQQQKQQRLAHQQQAHQQSNVPQYPRQQSAGSSRAASHLQKDPVVEEKISQLLNSMRQSSVMSLTDDDASTPNGNGSLPHIARMRKEEEDMDEDERLLASEEGKKLSSKERRQLRNKVSARAFRSRRKEYIGQLEGEIAAKTNEANDLKVNNRALMDENTRLSDLTRMLLSSSAFSTFLDDLSASGVPSMTPSVRQPIASTKDVKPVTRKDANPYQASQQQVQDQSHGEPQIGMALVPDHTMDLSLLNLNNSNAWANMGAGWNSNQPQVFSVLDVPEGPAIDEIDVGMLSGKTSNFVGSNLCNQEGKNELPTVEPMPICKVETTDKSSCPVQSPAIGLDESDPAFALFVDSPTSKGSTTVRCAEQMLTSSKPETTSNHIDLISNSEGNSDGEELSTATMEKFEWMCNSVEAAFERIGRMTSHL